jgi:predicted XRE-type DNA-binding protein
MRPLTQIPFVRHSLQRLEKLPKIRLETTMSKRNGSVSDALDESTEAAAEMKARASLMIELERFIARRKLTQAQAANLMRVTQPRISDLLTGKINLFSLDMLVAMATRAGARIEIKAKFPLAA